MALAAWCAPAAAADITIGPDGRPRRSSTTSRRSASASTSRSPGSTRTATASTTGSRSRSCARPGPTRASRSRPSSTRARTTRPSCRGNEGECIADADGDGRNDTWPLFYDNYFVPRGYAYVLAEMNGTANSTGCPLHGGPGDIAGMKSVIDWLNGRADAYATPARHAGHADLAQRQRRDDRQVLRRHAGQRRRRDRRRGPRRRSCRSRPSPTGTATRAERHPLQQRTTRRSSPTRSRRRARAGLRAVADAMSAADGDDTGDRNAFWDERDYLRDVGDVAGVRLRDARLPGRQRQARPARPLVGGPGRERRPAQAVAAARRPRRPVRLAPRARGSTRCTAGSTTGCSAWTTGSWTSRGSTIEDAARRRGTTTPTGRCRASAPTRSTCARTAPADGGRLGLSAGGAVDTLTWTSATRERDRAHRHAGAARRPTAACSSRRRCTQRPAHLRHAGGRASAPRSTRRRATSARSSSTTAPGDPGHAHRRGHRDHRRRATAGAPRRRDRLGGATSTRQACYPDAQAGRRRHPVAHLARHPRLLQPRLAADVDARARSARRPRFTWPLQPHGARDPGGAPDRHRADRQLPGVGIAGTTGTTFTLDAKASRVMLPVVGGYRGGARRRARSPRRRRAGPRAACPPTSSSTRRTRRRGRALPAADRHRRRDARPRGRLRPAARRALPGRRDDRDLHRDRRLRQRDDARVHRHGRRDGLAAAGRTTAPTPPSPTLDTAAPVLAKLGVTPLRRGAPAALHALRGREAEGHRQAQRARSGRSSGRSALRAGKRTRDARARQAAQGPLHGHGWSRPTRRQRAVEDAPLPAPLGLPVRTVDRATAAVRV